MPDNIVNTRIKLASRSATDWSTANPTLLDGEVGLDTTNKLIYVGDGSTAFNSLDPWNELPTNHVTTNTDQDITGTKTFVGQKKVLFKQSGSNDKLGFTLYTNSNVEKGYLEFNPTNKIDGYPLMTLGNYATATSGLTQVGFRRYSGISGANGAYNLLMPMISDAKAPFSLTTTYTNFYLPLGYKNGNTMVTAAKSGVVDLSSLIPTLPTLATVATSGLYSDLSGTPSLATVATSGLYSDLSGTPSLATVATSGLYSDLTGTPSLATVATSGLYSDLSGTPTLATVATSGSYTDLSNTPMEIPTISVGDAGKALVVNASETGVEWDTVGGSSLPTINAGDAGKVLAVNSNEDGVEWSDDLIELSSSVTILDNSVQSGLSSITSDLNAYKETANSRISQNADAIDSVSSSVTSLDTKYDGITQNLQTDIDTLANGDVATNTAFRLMTEGISYTGILWYESSTPVTGTAVGNLSFTTENGNKVLSRTGNYVTFTDSNNSISLWSGTTRIAYTENGRWHTSGSEGQSQTFGRYIVEDNANDGFVIRWGG